MKKQQVILEAKREEIERLIERINLYGPSTDFLKQLKNRSIYLARKIRELK